MPRKLKVYQTSIGFFDLVVAVPSMKAALEICGADSNLFHQGFASEVTDLKTTSAALDNPGIVLKRPVGTDQSFTVEAKLPRSVMENGPGKPHVGARKPGKRPSSSADDDVTTRKASAASARSKKEREATERREEAKRVKERERRDQRSARRMKPRKPQSCNTTQRCSNSKKSEKNLIDGRPRKKRLGTSSVEHWKLR